MLSNGLRNVPTTESSAKSPDLKPDPKFDTFVKIFSNPNTTTTAGDRRGQRLPGAVQQLRQQVAGRALDDLQAGLAGVDKQIDAQLANAQGDQVP